MGNYENNYGKHRKTMIKQGKTMANLGKIWEPPGKSMENNGTQWERPGLRRSFGEKDLV